MAEAGRKVSGCSKDPLEGGAFLVLFRSPLTRMGGTSTTPWVTSPTLPQFFLPAPVYSRLPSEEINFFHYGALDFTSSFNASLREQRCEPRGRELGSQDWKLRAALFVRKLVPSHGQKQDRKGPSRSRVHELG